MFYADTVRALSPVMARLEQATGNLLRRSAVPLKPRAVLVGASAFAAVVLIVAVFATVRKGDGSTAAAPAPAPALAPAVYAVNVRATPASAQLFVDGKPVSTSVPVELSAGLHRFEARQPGYRSAVEEQGISASSNDVNLQLQPLPARFRLTTAGDAKIRYNGQDRGVVVGGEFSAADLQQGEHLIEIAGPQGGAVSVAFQHEPGRPPALSRAPTARLSGTLVAAGFNGTAILRSTYPAARVVVDGQSAGQLADGMMELPLSPGEHEIALENEPASRLRVSAGDEPLVTASVWWAPPRRSIEERYNQAAALADNAKYKEALRIVEGILRESPAHEPSLRLKQRLQKLVEGF
jgi:hypothetical protein